MSKEEMQELRDAVARVSMQDAALSSVLSLLAEHLIALSSERLELVQVAPAQESQP